MEISGKRAMLTVGSFSRFSDGASTLPQAYLLIPGVVVWNTLQLIVSGIHVLKSKSGSRVHVWLTIKESGPGMRTTTYTQSKCSRKSPGLEARASHGPIMISSQSDLW